MNEIEVKLDQLADCYSQHDLLMMEKAELRDLAMPAEVKERLKEIDEEYYGMEKVVTENIASLEGEIKTLTLAEGATVKGSSMMAVWNKGRVSWDSRLLDGLMLIIPQLAEARKEGDPSVTIRRR